MKPRSLLISVGAWGGVYFRRGYTSRLCLGWIAFTWYPFDFDVLLAWPAEPRGSESLDLKQVIADAIQAALDEDRAAWYPAQRAVMAEKRPLPYTWTAGGRLVSLGELNAPLRPFPKTIQHGYTTMLVCPRCGTACIDTFCGMCCAPFDYTPTEDLPHGSSKP